MVYKSDITKKEVLLEEFGTEELTERIIVSPIEWNRVLPNNWLERLKSKGYKIKEIVPGDFHLKKIEKIT